MIRTQPLAPPEAKPVDGNPVPGRSVVESGDADRLRFSFWWLASRLLIAFLIGFFTAVLIFQTALSVADGSPAVHAINSLIVSVLALIGAYHLHQTIRAWWRALLFPRVVPRVKGRGPILVDLPREYGELCRRITNEVLSIYSDPDVMANASLLVKNGSRYMPLSVIERHPELLRLIARVLRSRVGEVEIGYQPIRTLAQAEEMSRRLPDIRVLYYLPYGLIVSANSVKGRIAPAVEEGHQELGRRGLFWAGVENRVVYPQVSGTNSEMTSGAVATNGVLDAIYIPLVMVEQVVYEPVPRERARKPGYFYLGTSLEGLVHTPFWHLLIVGKTGSGKTTLLRNLIADARESGFGVYIYSPKSDLESNISPEELAGFRVGENTRRIIIFIDEIAELFKAHKAVVATVENVAQMGRANGVFVVMATQNARGATLPVTLRQHLDTIVLATDPGEVQYLSTYYGIQIAVSETNETGSGIFLHHARRQTPIRFRFPSA